MAAAESRCCSRPSSQDTQRFLHSCRCHLSMVWLFSSAYRSRVHHCRPNQQKKGNTCLVQHNKTKYGCLASSQWLNTEWGSKSLVTPKHITITWTHFKQTLQLKRTKYLKDEQQRFQIRKLCRLFADTRRGAVEADLLSRDCAYFCSSSNGSGFVRSRQNFQCILCRFSFLLGRF